MADSVAVRVVEVDMEQRMFLDNPTTVALCSCCSNLLEIQCPAPAVEKRHDVVPNAAIGTELDKAANAPITIALP